MRALKEGRSLNETIYSRVRGLILTGQLVPGHKLKISALAQRFGVSLNVVREALSHLVIHKSATPYMPRVSGLK